MRPPLIASHLNLSIVSFIAALVSFALVGCGADDFAGGGSSGGGSKIDVARAAGDHATAGVLTAGDWDDGLNIEFFAEYLVGQHQQQSGVPGITASDAKNRVLIVAQDGAGEPLGGATVELLDGAAKTLFTVKTGSDGRANWLANHDAGGTQAAKVRVTPKKGDGEPQTLAVPVPSAATGTQRWDMVLEGSVAKANSALDIVFVLDATGSMRDELIWLQAEIVALSKAALANHSDASIRFGAVLYRDKSDDYVVRKLPLTADVNKFGADLDDQSAAGGGDYPEAMHLGLSNAMTLKWRPDATKLIFLIADAPPHQGPEESSALASVEKMRAAGVRVYPLAASGAAERTELIMRNAAFLTGGRYLFLTDDSGIGDKHAKPHIPCYLVQHLSKLVARVVDCELGGAWYLPKNEDIIATVGDPNSGVCTASDGYSYYIM